MWWEWLVYWLVVQALGDKLRDVGREYGVTTGRPRRCGWFDAVVARYSAMINGFTRWGGCEEGRGR